MLKVAFLKSKPLFRIEIMEIYRLLIFEILQYKLPENTLEVVKMPRSGCLQQLSFLDHVIYGVSLVTTVSYGQMYACSPYGQVFSVFYSMFGIPLMLMVLANLGRNFFIVLQLLQIFKK